MIFKTLLIYVLTSQLIVLSWVWWAINNCEQQNDHLGALNSVKGPRRFLVWTAAFLLQAAAAPFLLPWMLYQSIQCWRAITQEEQQLRSLYMELQLEPIHEANINDELLEHFETHTSPIMSSGFELLGDFYLKDEPYNAKARILLGNGQAVFAEIGTTLGVYYLELISFFENGEYASTCSIATFPNKEKFAQRGIHVNAVEPMDFAQLLASHLDFLASISAQIGQPVCEIDLPQWKDYHQYHNQKFGLVRYELGEIAEPPESCVFPTQSGDSQLETESPSFA